MTAREVEVQAEPIDAYEAAVEVLEDATTQGAFKVLIDEQARRYSIAWLTRLSGSRYDFRFERLGQTRSRVEVELQFSGFFGPLLRLLRASSNGPHLERILGDIRALAESEEFYEDGGAEEDDLEEDADAGGAGAPAR